MGDKKPLHIHIEPVSGAVFNAEIGWLSLPKASALKVSIKDYFEAKELLDKKLETDKKLADKQLKKVEQKIVDHRTDSYNFIVQNTADYNAGKVSKETYEANKRARWEGIADRKSESAKINIRHSSKIAELDAKYKADIENLKKEYASVRWVWQLIGSDRPQLTKESFNEAIISGEPELSLHFDDFLEGGGATYLEPFWEGTAPVGKYPHGVIINAKGVKPQVLMADWRDANDNLITETVKFGSTVFLNIYTEALYGRNIKIQLLDQDKVIRILSLGLTNADDKLFAAEYPDNNIKVEDREEKDILKKDNQFIRAVSVHKTLNVPAGAKSGKLVDEGESHKDKKVDYVEKKMIFIVMM